MRLNILKMACKRDRMQQEQQTANIPWDVCGEMGKWWERREGRMHADDTAVVLNPGCDVFKNSYFFHKNFFVSYKLEKKNQNVWKQQCHPWLEMA